MPDPLTIGDLCLAQASEIDCLLRRFDNLVAALRRGSCVNDVWLGAQEQYIAGVKQRLAGLYGMPLDEFQRRLEAAKERPR